MQQYPGSLSCTLSILPGTQHLLTARHSAKSDTVADLKEPRTWRWGHRPTNTGKKRMPTNTEEDTGLPLSRGTKEGFKEASLGLDFYGFQQAEMRPGRSRQRE